MGELEQACEALTRAVSGINWEPAAVERALDVILPGSAEASPDELSAALETLVERLERASVQDADGVAHVAITSGTLVEYGAPPEPVSEVLLAKLPEVLSAARRYADRCLADPRCPEEYPEDDGFEALVEIDGRPIDGALFQSFLKEDRPGATALYHLQRWTLPTVAALTRDRKALVRATSDAQLRRQAAALVDSDAHFLHVLLGAQLDARWLVLCPVEGRGFSVELDGIVGNHDLHALLAAQLVPRGIAGVANPEDVIALLEGRASRADTDFVRGSWNLYDYRASPAAVAQGSVPHDHWLWGEGSPVDVPEVDGQRVLLIGPTTIERTWSLARTFSALPARVRVVEELTKAAYREALAACARAAQA